jgi:outer membrane receptor for ferrienterochelin and colicins
MKVLYLIILCLLSFALESYSQTYSIYGNVKDAEGKALPGVNVIVTGLNTGDATNVKGDYTVKGLEKGEYTLQFSAIGFRRVTRKVNLMKDTRLDVMLETEAFITEQVIVSAGKHEQRLSDLPVSAAIIDNKDMLRFNHSNLRDALKYIPGVNLVEDQLSIRGSSGYSRGAGSRVLMAIDGLPFYTGDTGEIIWEAIPVNEVERVEIIKGASSSLYGSTAIGGVINVVTREINQPFTYIKTFIGGYDKPSHDLWDWSSSYRLFNGQSIAHSNLFGKLSFSAAFTRLEDEGYRRNNFNKRYIGYLKGGYKFSDASSLSLLFNSLNQYSGNFIYWKDSRSALEPPDEDIGQTVKSDRYMMGLISDNKLSSNFDLIMRGSFYTTKWTDETASRNSAEADQYRGEIQTNYRVNPRLLFINGFELNYSTVSSNIFGTPEAYGAGVYSQGELSFNFPLLLTGGLRYDYNRVNDLDGDYALSPRLGFNYKFTERIILRGMLGTGFRAPSLAEKFTQTFVSGIGIKPNPAVEPESNITFETGVLLLTDLGSLDAAVFRNGYYDMIEPIVDLTDGNIMVANLVRARIQGAEFNITPRISNEINLSLNYTFMIPEDLNTGKTLKYRPKHLFYSSVSYAENGFEAGLNFRYWSRVEEVDIELVDLGFIPDGEKRVEVFVLDLNTGYNFIQMGLPVRVYLNIKNLLNYNYIELIGNIAPLRNIALSFELFL